jgi:hypothetical protein
MPWRLARCCTLAEPHQRTRKSYSVDPSIVRSPPVRRTRVRRAGADAPEPGGTSSHATASRPCRQSSPYRRRNQHSTRCGASISRSRWNKTKKSRSWWACTSYLNAGARKGGLGRSPPALIRAYRRVYGRDPRGWPRSERETCVHNRSFEDRWLAQFVPDGQAQIHGSPDAPHEHSSGSDGARQEPM